MAVASGSLRSSLNPNAPLFIPAALQQVEDFSPEWWNLVQTNTWFREHWLQEHQELEKAEDDVANLLPETFDVGFEDEIYNFDDLDGDAVFHQAFAAVGGEPYFPQKQTKPQNVDVGSVLRTLNLASPRYARESPRRENFNPAISPKPSPRRMIIQQPR